MPRRGSTKHISRDYAAGRLESEVKQLETTLNGVFSDKEFPPTTLSLIDTREVPPFVLDVPKFSRHTAWKRASQIHQDNLDPAQAQHASKQQLFTLENLNPTAVKQGGLENCYFLASLSSLSQSPDRITRLFLPQTNPDLGIYAVRLFANGAPKEVVVDDYLPIEKQTDELPRSNPEDNLPKGAKVNKKTKVDNGDGTSTLTLEIQYPDGRMQIKRQTMDNDAVATRLKFSRTTTDELWVPILEKAYAKVQGSYAALEAGCHFETIRDLTGAPGFYWMSVEDSHWPIMQSFYDLGYPMSCGIDFKYNMPWSQQDLQNAGLVPMHVYSILGVCTVSANGTQQRLIKLRNPWGDAMEWTGNWSNKSPLWTSSVRHQIQLFKGIPLEDPAAQDGIFWMPFEDFRRYFNSWDVNKYHDSHQFSAAILQNHQPGYHLVTIHVQQPGPYTFGVSQTSNRMMPTSANYKYSSVRAIFVKARRDEEANDDDRLNGCQFLKGVVGENRDEYIEIEHLEPGMYYLFVQVWWDASAKHLPRKEISVNCYGTARVKFSQDISPVFSIEKVLTETFAAKAKQEMLLGGNPNLASRQRGQPEAQHIQEYHNINTCPEGYAFRIICNRETTPIALQEDKKYIALQNAELVKPAKNSPQYKVSGKDSYSIRVGPGETKGVFLMVKSSFGMAGPSGKAILILPDGATIAERESQQSETTQPNLPYNTGLTRNTAPPIDLETLHTGSGMAVKGRKASVLGSVISNIRASIVGSADMDGVRSSIKRKSTKGPIDDPTKSAKRRSIFGGWGRKSNASDNVEEPTSPPTSPDSDTQNTKGEFKPKTRSEPPSGIQDQSASGVDAVAVRPIGAEVVSPQRGQPRPESIQNQSYPAKAASEAAPAAQLLARQRLLSKRKQQVAEQKVIWQEQQQQPQQVVNQASSEETQENLRPLPDGWSQDFDPNWGQYYFHNQAEGTTTWVRPASKKENDGVEPSIAVHSVAPTNGEISPKTKMQHPDAIERAPEETDDGQARASPTPLPASSSPDSNVEHITSRHGGSVRGKDINSSRPPDSYRTAHEGSTSTKPDLQIPHKAQNGWTIRNPPDTSSPSTSNASYTSPEKARILQTTPPKQNSSSSAAQSSAEDTELKKPKPSLFKKLFRKARKGRQQTLEEQKILAKYKDLRNATVLENTCTVTTTTATYPDGSQGVVATTTVTILRLMK